MLWSAWGRSGFGGTWLARMPKIGRAGVVISSGCSAFVLLWLLYHFRKGLAVVVMIIGRYSLFCARNMVVIVNHER